MPQIWPMNWVLLFILFLMSFLTFIVLVYFFTSRPTVGSGLKMKILGPNLPWLW